MIKGLALVLALSYCSTINAGIIFSNEITGPAPENFNPFTDGQFVDAHVVVSGIGRGSGIAGTSGQDRYNARSWLERLLQIHDRTPSGIGNRLQRFQYTG